MTESEIDRLEKTINKKLPEWYKAFLMNYPGDLINLGAPYNTVSELSLPNSADRLIEINEYENSPVNILVIGVDGLGNFYYVILNDNDTRIYLFNHEAPIFIDDNDEQIDWRKSYDLVFENIEELIADLKDNLTAEEIEGLGLSGYKYLQASEVSIVIECEMKDEWQNNRNLELADTYPHAINSPEVAKLLSVKHSVFEGYPEDYTITYSYLVSIDKNGEIINPDFQGGDDMSIINDINDNIKLLKFRPGVRNKVPVDSYTIVRYKLKLK